IDYDTESLKGLAEFAREENCEVVTASDGITGLEKFKADRPDLVIMEAMLPKLHGFELCKKIAYDSSKKVPVIIVTGIYRESVYKSEAIRFYGASAFFEKPWKKEDLQPVVRDLLKGGAQPSAEPPPAEPVGPPVEAAEPPPPAEKKKKKEIESADEWGIVLPGDDTRADAAGEADAGPDVEAEIDTMLESALADLGLKGGHEEKPERPEEKERHKPPKETPVFSPPAETKEEPAPHVREEVHAAPKAGAAPFGGFIEEPETKKSKAGLFIGIGAVVVAAAAVYLFVLKPKPSAPTPSETAQQTESAADAGEAPSTEIPSAADILGTEQSPAASEPASSEPQPEAKPVETKPAETKPAAKPQAAPSGATRTQTGGRTSDSLAPIMPAQTPSLQMQEPAPPPAKTPAQKQEPVPETPVVRRAQEGDLIPLDQVDAQPVTVKTVAASYPEIARRMGVEGTVVVNALISETGDVIQTQILRGIRGTYGFDRAAETAIRQYKFRPAMKDGARVKVWKPFNVVFRK
ncbi:MAG: TonB family protein, partial [Candidatus Aminicenantes bacterium]|nr:TonB family protein [Candidatus Aminicenantes bacterium]